jgi:hypothetical protein
VNGGQRILVTVGMLSHRKDPRTVYKSYAYAAAAKMEGVDFYFFSPGRVNFKKRRINGWVYENGQWIQKNMPFPDVIYNASPPQTDKQEEIIDRLSATIPFTSHSIGNKLDVYYKIKNANRFAQYLIPFTEITEPQNVLDFLSLYNEIVIKPHNGHKGQNILFVKKKGNKMHVQQNKTTVIMNMPECKKFIKDLTKNIPYFAQAFIESKTKSGLSTHFRLHTQKNVEGEWQLTTIFPCIAQQGIVANLSSGGYTLEFEEFIKQEFDDEHYNIKRYLEQFAIHFTKHFDSLYCHKLDELGIDVGLDKDNKIWIFEVNWRPGTPPTFSLELDVAKQMIRYAWYLAQKKPLH